MDNSTILYKGLVGSQLYKCGRTSSDLDYVVIMPHNDEQFHQRIETETGIIDLFRKEACYMEYLLFDEPPVGQDTMHVVEMLFSEPTDIHTALTDWLLTNRKSILYTNRPYFYQTLTWRAKTIVRDEANIYMQSPKNMLMLLVKLYICINFAANDDYIYASFTEEQSQVLSDILNNKLTNLEIFQLLQTTLQEVEEHYIDFWNVPKNEIEQSRLKESLRVLLTELIGEEYYNDV